MTPDVAASVRARLLARAKSMSEEFERTLARFAAERLLYRLGASSARERCFLKGASLLSVWLPNPYRVTRDVDVLAFGCSDDTAVRALLEEICAVPCPEDGLRFDLSMMRVETIRPEEEYAGKRARFFAHLGSARIAVQVDLGFGDAPGLETEDVEYPTILLQLPAPRVLAYRREASVAEKFEAMVKLGPRNSRMKDFHDVWALSSMLPFDGPALRQAISACFDRRGTPQTSEPPPVLTPDFYQIPELVTRWRNYLALGVVLSPPPSEFGAIGERVIDFLAPVHRSVAEGTSFMGTWKPGGPWRG